MGQKMNSRTNILLSLFCTGSVILNSVCCLAETFDLPDFKQPEQPNIITATPKLLRNADFEALWDGWATAPGFSFERHGGCNSSGGIVYERIKPDVYAVLRQNVNLEKGKLYRFGAWVKTENVQGSDGGATVGLEYGCKTASGVKYLGGKYLNGVKGSTEWTQLSGSVTIPDNADVCSLVLYMSKGVTGKAWFDDAFIRPASSIWSCYMAQPAFNSVSDKDPTLVLAFNRDAASSQNANTKNLYYQVEIVGKDYRRQLGGILNADRINLTIPQPVSPGLYTMKISIINPVEKRILHTVEQPLNIYVANRVVPANACLFDNRGRAIVSGKRFMPIGVYTTRIDRKMTATLRDAGFNCLLPYDSMFLTWDNVKGIPGIRGAMDHCHEMGLKVIFSVKGVYADVPLNLGGVRKWHNLDREDAIINSVVENFKNHPALLSWYVNDESPISMLPELTSRRNLLNRLDPFHPTLAVLYQLIDLPLYGPSCDILGIDHYPIGKASANNISSIEKYMRKIEFSGKTAWVVPQAFNPAVYNAKKPEDFALYRAPSESELRTMTLTMAAMGAKGFIFYKYEDIFSPKLPPDNFNKYWQELVRTVKTLRELEPFIMSDFSAVELPVELSSGKANAWLMRDDSGKTRIILVAPGPGLTKGRISLPAGTKFRSAYGLTEFSDSTAQFCVDGINADLLISE